MSPTSYRTAPPRGDRLEYDEPGFAPACDEKGASMGPGLLARRIPKIHLHCHLEGTLRAQTFLELARNYDVPLRYDPKETRAGKDAPLERDPYAFSDMTEFLYLFAAVSRTLKEPHDYARMAREFVEDALA